jgi:hypothetical protein
MRAEEEINKMIVLNLFAQASFYRKVSLHLGST